MSTVYLRLVLLLTMWSVLVQSSTLQSTTKKPIQSSAMPATTTKGPLLEEKHVPLPNITDQPDRHIIVPIENIIFSLDQNTLVQLTNLQLLVPSEFHIGEIDPDFSKMVLNVNFTVDSLVISGDYSIFVNNYMSLPISSLGQISMNFKNITAFGRTALALTPAALLALSYEFVYKPEAVSVAVVPLSKQLVTQEIRLSKDILNEPVIGLINKELNAILSYYVETEINFKLGQISVFTVGHKKTRSLVSEPFNQNVQIGDLFDEMLMDVRRVVVETNKDEIRTPNFHRNFSEKLESAYINGTFSAVNGWISGISTLQRASNVSLSKTKEGNYIISAGVEFEYLEMGYDKYTAKFLKTDVVGELDGNFLNRIMTLKISMQPNTDGTCSSVLNELKVFKMNGYRIKNITNIGSMDWLRTKINNWLVGYFQTMIVKEVQNEIIIAFRNSLSRFDCGEYLPHLRILN